ncbi:hypothetical protein D3C72_813770 [compost metagenome]
MGNQPKYLKQYQGFTSGTPNGREDGFPETKSVVYTDIRDLAAAFGTRKDERYFRIQEADTEELALIVKDTKEAMLQEKQDAERRRDLAELKRLQEKLGNQERGTD